jgi:GNAT superfamily N-acetyltransferase
MALPPDALARQRAATVAIWRADVATRPAGEWAQLADAAVHTTGLAVRHWNGAHVTGPHPDLGGVAAWFRRRGMPYGVLVPEDSPFDPGSPLLTTQRVMLRDLEGLPALPQLDLHWDDAEGAALVQQEAFDDELAVEFVLPKLRNPACAVVTLHEGPAVATGTLVVADGTAGLYGIGALSAYRRRGLGGAVTLALLHEARARGCDLAFLNPSDDGYRLYARLGFTDAPGWRVHEGT